MFVRNFDLKLVETKEENIKLGRDKGLPYPVKGRFSVRVRITEMFQS